MSRAILLKVNFCLYYICIKIFECSELFNYVLFHNIVFICIASQAGPISLWSRSCNEINSRIPGSTTLSYE